MSLNFFENGIKSGMIQTPNDYFRDLQQAAIDERWEYTSARYTVKEQDGFGESTYHDIEVWMDYVVGLGNRGTTNGDDFRQLIFQDIYHPVMRGLYYQFDGNYWLTYFTDEVSSLSKDAGVRRCNNVLKVRDESDGSIFKIPCVVDYDMSSPGNQVSKYIVTPNNHATVLVQGNVDTIRLFTLNTRFIISGRPFKLLGYQNTLMDESISNYPTLLYLDLYLDEIHAEDDLVNGIADNGEVNYSVEINAEDMELLVGSEGKLTASVLFNGKEVDRHLVWSSSNNNIVVVDNNGNYKIVGKDGASCLIRVELENNANVFDTIRMTVMTQETIHPKIDIVPMFNKIRQFETKEFEIVVNYGSDSIIPVDIILSLSKEEEVLANNYLVIEKGTKENQFSISALKIAKIPQHVYIKIQNQDPVFEVEEDFVLDVVSMMG